jgi:hypothetical protein
MSYTRRQDAPRDAFPKVGDDEAEVVNTSGAHWPGSQMQARPRTITAPPPGRALSHRSPIEIDAESGQRLGTRTERALSQAAGKLSIAETIDRASVSERGMLRHIFGLNLPGRGRA